MCAARHVSLRDGQILGIDLYIPPRNSARVSWWEATHCSSASALQTRFEAAAVSCDGLRSGYTEMISWSSDVMTPNSPLANLKPTTRVL
jgi:hypothetical protein